MQLRSRLSFLYSVAFFASAGSTLLNIGIFYYTVNQWGWNAGFNLTLAAGQGIFSTFGALLAHRISTRWGRRKSLVAIYLLMALAALVAAMSSSHGLIALCLLLYMFFTGMNWPMLESLSSESGNAHQMSRRIGMYNFTWAIAGVGALFFTGLLIEHGRSALFVVPVVLHLASVALLFVLLFGSSCPSIGAAARLKPEPDLLHMRTLAMWLARIALPSMYVVNAGLSAILPSLPIMRHFSPESQTLFGSIWVVSRMLMFAVLAATVFWHIRPRLLLAAAGAMLLGFIFATVTPSQMLHRDIAAPIEIAAMIAGQVVLGAAMSMIYTASLYFGMVLSDSSTEHSGYHEALIGLGGALGAGSGALTQYAWPGEVSMAVAAVGGVVGLSVAAAATASIILRRRRAKVR